MRALGDLFEFVVASDELDMLELDEFADGVGCLSALAAMPVLAPVPLLLAAVPLRFVS